MAKSRKKQTFGKIAGPIFVALAGLLVLSFFLLRGTNVALFNPKGMIAQQQHNLFLVSIGIMMIIGIPALFLMYFVAWKYRESNHKAKRDDEAGHGKLLNVSMWVAPFVIMITLASIMVPATHRLEPQKTIAADAEPLTIQVIALRWKWLFIYPEQNIATVNYVQIPTDTPVTFQLTADDTPMSSFWIPNLGGMLYAMTGHINKLNLIADTPGDYPGSTAEINGEGFAGMKFTANASSKQDFDRWVREVSLSGHALNGTEYDKLLKPSEDNPVSYYSLADNDLYATVVMKYMGSHSQGGEGSSANQHTGHQE